MGRTHIHRSNGFGHYFSGQIDSIDVRPLGLQNNFTGSYLDYLDLPRTFLIAGAWIDPNEPALALWLYSCQDFDFNRDFKEQVSIVWWQSTAPFQLIIRKCTRPTARFSSKSRDDSWAVALFGRADDETVAVWKFVSCVTYKRILHIRHFCSPDKLIVPGFKTRHS